MTHDRLQPRIKPAARRRDWKLIAAAVLAGWAVLSAAVSAGR